MADAGRKKKCIIEVSQKYGLGIEGTTYTVEQFSPTQGWRPVKWYSHLHEAAESLVELTAKGRVVEMLGQGVSKLSKEVAERILREVEVDAARIVATIKQEAAAERLWGM